MKKKLICMLLTALLCASLPIAVLADSEETATSTAPAEYRTAHVIDRADVFSVLDMQMADMKLSSVLNTYGVDVAVFAVDDIGLASADTVAKSVYDDEDGDGERARGYGSARDGALIMIETSTKKITLYGIGKGEVFANNSMKSYFSEHIKDFLDSGNYSSALLEIANIVDHFALLSLTPLPTTDAPVTDNPTTDAPVTDNPTTDAPVTDNPTTDAPVTDNPTTDAPVTDNPTTDAPVTDNPTTDAPVTDNPTTDAPVTDNPTTDAPVTDNHTTDAPVTDNPTTDAPATDNPTTDAPVTDNPTTDAPATDKPTTDAPATNEPEPEKPKNELPWQTKFAIAVVISVVASLIIAGITFGAMTMYNMNRTRGKKSKRSKKKSSDK